MPMCGAASDVRPATDEDQKIAEQVKSDAEAKAGQQFPTFTVHSVKTQLVAGTNYFFKVHVGDEKYIHLRVYETLPHAGSKLELSAIQLEKTQTDEIEYFQ